MKFTIFLIFFSILQAYSNVFVQKETMSLEVESATVEEVFQLIQEETGYRFLYNTENINLTRKISISAVDRKLEYVLNRIFKRTDINYVIIDKQIILKRKTNNKRRDPRRQSKNSVLDKTPAQDNIYGQVTDVDGVPLFGVSVLIKDSQKGVATDEDGTYTITATKGDIIAFSYLGFFDVEITVSDKTAYNVVMTESSMQLQGVEVVSTGYQKIEKTRATGSFERVKEQTLERKINQDIISKIRGEVAGVLFDPNVDTRNSNNSLGITIRGTSSLRANTEPLIVVDGFPIRGGLNTINPNDVESISILKDAASASIWGIRATNGVIVIVTKKGSRNNKLSIDASLITGFTLKTDIFSSPFASPETQTLYQETLFNTPGYFNPDQLFNGALNTNSFNQPNGVFEALGLATRGDITDEEAQNRISRIRRTDGRKQYSDLFLRPQLWNQYNLALAKGGEKYNTRASISYNSNLGELAGSDSDQFIINFSNDFTISSKLKARASVNFSQQKQNNNSGLLVGPEGFFQQSLVNRGIVDADGNTLPGVIGASQQSSDLALSQGYSYPWTYNLKQEFDNADVTDINTEIRLQTGLSYELFKGLNLDLSYQYEWSQRNGRNLRNENTFFVRDLVNGYTQVDTDGNPTSFPVPAGSILDLMYGNLATNTFRTQLNYDNTFADGEHRLTAIVGYEARKTVIEGNQDRKYGYNDQSLVNILPDFTTQYAFPLRPFERPNTVPQNSRISYIENRFLSYYANLAYTYDYVYTLSGSTRLDDTNLFGSSKEFRNIPLFSLGFKWNLGQKYFQDNNTINSLQLRATYGTNGNVDRSTSPFLQTRSAFDPTGFGNIFSVVSSLPNPELRLEKTATLNLGVDFGLFNNLLSGSVEYYEKNSSNLLADRQLNPTVGVTSALLNTGELFNKGFDVSLTGNFINTTNFTYATTAIFSLNENKLTKVDVPQENVNTYVGGLAQVQGSPLNTLFSYQYGGLDNNGAPQYINENNELIDVSGAITSVDALVNEGTTVPRYYGSFINDIRYKNLSLRILTTYSAGHVFRNNNSFNPGPSLNTFEDFNDRWQTPGDQNFTDIPALPSAFDAIQNGYDNYEFADKFVDNAAHIRLSEVILGYGFPDLLTEKLSMQAFQISLQANNLKVWNFNKWNVDPLNPLFPRSPTFSINLSAQF